MYLVFLLNNQCASIETIIDFCFGFLSRGFPLFNAWKVESFPSLSATCAIQFQNILHGPFTAWHSSAMLGTLATLGTCHLVYVTSGIRRPLEFSLMFILLIWRNLNIVHEKRHQCLHLCTLNKLLIGKITLRHIICVLKLCILKENWKENLLSFVYYY